MERTPLSETLDSFMYFALTIFSELLSFMILHLVTEYLSILGASEMHFHSQNT